jgi:hypothetical protein
VNFKTTLHLFLAVCLLGFSIWILNIFSARKDQPLSVNDRIFQTDLNSVDYLLINSTNLQIECKKNNSEWMFTHPLKARADEEKIKQLISSIESTEYIDTITSAQRVNRELDLDDFGFNSKSPKLVIGTGTNRYNLLLGTYSPMGDLIYVKFTDKDEVMVVRSSILDIFPKNIDSLRARTLIPGTTMRTSKLMIQKGGSFIELLRNEENDWQIVQPVQFSADNKVVNNILDVLYTAKVNSFEWDKLTSTDSDKVLVDTVSSDASSRNNSYSLTSDLATLIIKVWIADNSAGTELLLGKFTDESKKYVYAKLSDNNTIFTCNADLISTFDRSISELRNKSLIHIPYNKINQLCFENNDVKLILRKNNKSGWTILEPVKWKADDEVVDSIVQMLLSFRIDKFIETQATNSVEPSDIATKICVSTLSEADLCLTTNADLKITPTINDVTVTQRILMMKNENKEAGNVMARYEDSDAIILKLNTIIKNIFYKNLTEPLFFRDRSMLSLDRNSITRIELNKNGKMQAVTKTEDGVWTSENQDIKTVNKNAIEDLLFIAANMRALRIESDNVKKIEAYGLDQVTISVTFGLSGEDGIQKTVQLGFRAGTDGIYARIQGEDTIFVISTELAANITQDVY